MLPSPTDPRWGALVDHPDRHEYSFLGLKILMQRIALQARKGMSPAERTAAIDEVVAFFAKQERLLGDDIASIFSPAAA